MSSSPTFVKVAPKVKVKAGGILAKLEKELEEKEKEICVLKEQLTEVGKEKAAAEEKNDIFKSQLDDMNNTLENEKAKTKHFASELEILKFAIQENKISKKEMERITDQVRKSGYLINSKTKTPEISPGWASNCIEMEIEELISRLGNAEAKLALTEDRCEYLETKNAELELQRNQHMRHSDIVIKDKKRLADELQALKDFIKKSEAEESKGTFPRSPLSPRN